MVRAENGAYDGMLFDLAEGMEYFVEAAGVRSPNFTLKVVELPYVKQLDLEYHFPSYTGLAPRTVEDGGDVATLRGTDVRVRSSRRWPSPGGRLVMADGSSSPLSGQRRRHARGQLHRVRRTASIASSSTGPPAKRSTRRPITPSTSSPIRRRRSRCRSPAATPMRRRCRNSSSKRAPTTTSPCAICSSCIRSTAATRRRSACSAAASPRPR